jgi:DNA-nicking Smr family endonuclease
MSAEDAPFAFDPEAEAEYPINGELDLHTFAPRDVPYVVQDYLDECQRRGILEIRIVHGKARAERNRCMGRSLR